MRPYRVKSLDNTAVFSAGLSLPGHISAPAKLPAPGSDVFSSDFCFLRRRLAESAYSRRCCRATFLWSEAGASQDEKSKKRRKDTLSGVFALVDRWYPFHILHVLFGAITMSEKKKVLVAMSGGVDIRRAPRANHRVPRRLPAGAGGAGGRTAGGGISHQAA